MRVDTLEGQLTELLRLVEELGTKTCQCPSSSADSAGLPVVAQEVLERAVARERQLQEDARQRVADDIVLARASNEAMEDPASDNERHPLAW